VRTLVALCMGRIAEELDARDAAAHAYANVDKPRRPNGDASSSYALAQKKLSTLRP
jgi:hypothetical protein